MRVFISYAHVDGYYCQQFVNFLEDYDVLYDKRLKVGTEWWKEIVNWIESCDIFLYLLSPESVISTHCRRELQVAISKGKAVFPILIQPRTEIPESISHIEVIDATMGLTSEVSKRMIVAIYSVEGGDRSHVIENTNHNFDPTAMPEVIITPATFHDKLATALEIDNLDFAMQLVAQAIDQSLEDPLIPDLNLYRLELQKTIAQRSYLRDAQREYRLLQQIIRTVNNPALLSNIWERYYKNFPDYDPEEIGKDLYYSPEPDIEWVSIPKGEVKLRYKGKQPKTYWIEEFEISKYPITNLQFDTFLKAKDGYKDPRWWNQTEEARKWFAENPEPYKIDLKRGQAPRVFVSWFEAMAFCQWLGSKTGFRLRLPNDTEWQFAASGTEGWKHTWGPTFDPKNCNWQENGPSDLTDVHFYKKGASPFGVVDMLGNAWEWCYTKYDDAKELKDAHKRITRGGSYSSGKSSLTTQSYVPVEPHLRIKTIGFRIIRLPKL
ncbi:hypothetical protein MASR2M15_21830 [Anaerolineales bacterium]